MILLIGTLVVGGCKDKVPVSELEQFRQRYESLPPAALEDTLRSYLAAGQPFAAYASYFLGNRFYLAANDSATVGGWESDYVNAQLDSAEFYLTRAVELDSTFLEAMVNLGAMWDDRSNQMRDSAYLKQCLDNAEKYYRQAQSIDPYNEKARCNLGSLYLRLRRTREAMAEFLAVLDHDPKSPLAHYHMAIMFAEAKIYREAMAEWELAAKYDPDGDIGSRSRENIKIIHDLLNAPTPDSVK